MSLTQFFYEPFYSLSDFDKLFDEAFSARAGNGQLQRGGRRNVGETGSGFLRPRMDVHEDTQSNTVTATFELPGLKKEDVQIDIHNNALMVSGETKVSSERDEKGYAVEYKFIRQMPHRAEEARPNPRITQLSCRSGHCPPSPEHPQDASSPAHVYIVFSVGHTQLKLIFSARQSQHASASRPSKVIPISPNEITPGIPAEEYERRRSALMSELPEGSVVVSVAGQVKYMSGGIFYKFRQASDFWYLTGFEEPDSAVILEKNGSPRGYRMILYSLGRDPVKEKWDGARTNHADAVSIFRADDARPLDALPADLKSFLPRASSMYVDVPSSKRERVSRTSAKSLLKYLVGTGGAKGAHDSVLEGLASAKRRPLAPLVGKLRSVKSKAEQAVMKEAADISGNAHAKTMRFAQPGQSEHELAAHFEYLCARSGSQRPAYVPVVASGENALIIHYTKNDNLLFDGELVLVDAGCEYNGYASDITRTFPANGTFTAPQRELYAALLSVQKACVALCASANGHSLNDLHYRSVELLRQELKQIGFELGWQTGVLERILYPHYLSHSIGVDLHESGSFDRGARLEKGMVVTIEPGIYVPKDPAFPKHFQGLGIRIEDEVLIGEKDPVVLSSAAPKEIADVEGACQGLLGFEPF